MKILNDLNTSGHFSFGEYEFPGTLITNEKKSIEIRILLNYYVEAFQGEPVEIPRIDGVLRKNGENVIIFDAILTRGFWSSNGIIEYIIRSNVMIYGNIDKKINDNFEIEKVSIISSAINDLFGNFLLKANYKIDLKTWFFEIQSKSEKILVENKLFTFLLKSFYNFGNNSLQRKINIEQINSIEIIFSEKKSIYEIINYIKKIENLLSFIFKENIGIDEVFSSYEIEIEGKKREFNYNIYYKDENKSDFQLDLSKSIFNRTEIKNSFGNIILNWFRLDKKIPYLNYFIRLFYTNEFVDQKVVAQINLLEAIHRYYYGDKQLEGIVKERNESIYTLLSESPDELAFIRELLENKTGYGLKKKIKDLKEKMNDPDISQRDIKKINDIRIRLSHGIGDKRNTLKLEDYNNIFKKLDVLIESIIKYELLLENK